MSYQPYDRSPSGIIFFGTNSTDQVYESVSTLVYDSGNNRVGINNAAPGGSLHVDNLQLDGNTLSITNNNGSLILSPNGNGAIQADSGGNARGNYAVDLQRNRASAGQVASGSCSFIGNGVNNTASNSYSTVVNGASNCVTGSWGFIGGGDFNCVTGSGLFGLGSSIVGGNSNYISTSGDFSFIGGGASNCVCNSMATIGGGLCNSASGYGATIAGGDNNKSNNSYSTVGGGYNNCATGLRSTVSGGHTNKAYGSDSTISGGYDNCAGDSSVVAGGSANCAGNASAVVGGLSNTTGGSFTSFIGAGAFNEVANGLNTAIVAGTYNIASGDYSAIVGGANNSTASAALYSFIGGGCCNTACGCYSTVGGGYNNIASGCNSTVGGGLLNVASGDYSAVVAGSGNLSAGACSFVGGGENNTSSSCYSSVLGGKNNTVSNSYGGAILGGASNSVAGWGYSAILAGYGNYTLSNSYNAVIGGGYNNCIDDSYGFIANGRHHKIESSEGFIGGGLQNYVQPSGSIASNYGTIVNGESNRICGGPGGFIGNGGQHFIGGCGSDSAVIVGGWGNCSIRSRGGFIGGGWFNTLSSCYSTIGGGKCNVINASAHYSFVGGGQTNFANGSYATVGGGCCNTASGRYSTVSGGRCNITNARHSNINGGHRNVIQSPTNECCSRGATIGGGIGHNSSGGTLNATTGDLTGTITCCNAGVFSTIGGGLRNCTAGAYSTVNGGAYNSASGCYSSVVGYCNFACHTNSHIIGSGITSSAADTLYTNNICANGTITGTSIIKYNGTSSQFLKADGSVDSTGYTTCVGTVTSVAAGSGMNFGTITTTGSITLGTPSNVTLSSTNSLTSNSHTHAFAPGGDTTEYIRGDGTLAAFPTNVASGVGASGHIAFWTDTNSLSYDNNELFWDQANNRLGIGTSSPSYDLDVDGVGRFTGTLNVNGDLIVNGTTTTVNSTVVTIEDPILVLGSGTPTTDDNKDRGIAFNYFSGSAKQGFFGYDDDEQKFTFMTDATITGEVVSGTVGTIKANLVGDVTGNADTATLATDASGLTSSVTIELDGQLSGSDTFQDAGDTATITATLTSNAITDQTEITSVDGANDHILIYDSGVGLRKVTPQNFIDDLNIVTSFNVSDGTTNVTVEQGETLSFADGTGAEFVVTNNAGQPTITVNSVDSEIVHDNLSGFVGNEHINHTGVILTAGAGLTGGGDITASRTFNIGQGNGITVNADDVALASTVAGSGLNYNAGVLNIGAGTGMSINGTTVGLANTDVTANTYGTASQVGTFTVDAQGRLTNAVNTSINITASQVSDFTTESEAAIFTAANFTDSTRIDFTVTNGVSVTADLIANTVSETYLTASVAGSGLTGGNGSALAVGAGDGLSVSSTELSVNVDDATIEINSDTLRVKDGGITEAKISRTVSGGANPGLSNNDTISKDVNLVTGGPGGIQIKLPAPVEGKIVYVKKIDASVGAVTVLPNASETIDDASQKILYSQSESLSFVSDGTDWYII